MRFPDISYAYRQKIVLVFICAFLNVALRSLYAYKTLTGTTGVVGWVFTAFDIAIISIAVRFTGGIHSDIRFIFFMIVVMETLNVSLASEIGLMVMVFIGFMGAVWPVADTLTLISHLFFLYLTGAVARRLHDNSAVRSAQASLLHEQLTVEQEKSRVAREIHDGIGREIVNAILGLEIASRVAEKEPESVVPMINDNVAILRSAMNSTRNLVFETRPWSANGSENTVTVDLVQHCLQQFEQRNDIKISLNLIDDINQMGSTEAFALMRILQEALINISKHARAENVLVHFSRERDSIRMLITDDGKGFDPIQIAYAQGIGISAMRERAMAVGGTFDIRSNPGNGTSISAALPVNSAISP